jgi:plastocyanin
MRLLTPTLSICALAAAFAAGALTAAPHNPPSPAAAAAPPGALETTTSVSVSISAFAFAVSNTNAAPGATVVVVNADADPHTVTAVDGSFDVFVDAGATVSFSAPVAAGSYEFFCSIHPSMRGVLTVT